MAGFLSMQIYWRRYNRPPRESESCDILVATFKKCSLLIQEIENERLGRRFWFFNTKLENKPKELRDTLDAIASEIKKRYDKNQHKSKNECTGQLMT